MQPGNCGIMSSAQPAKPCSDATAFPCPANERGHMDWNAITLAIRLASLTPRILVIGGLPLASWLAACRWRWKFLVESVVALPLVLPPTVLGFYLLLALGPRSPIGRFYESLTGHLLPFSFQGLLIASVLYSLPFAVQPFAAAFAAVDQRLVEASSLPG